MGDHYYEQRAQARKLSDLYREVKVYSNWLKTEGLGGPYGLGEVFRSEIINPIIVKNCQLLVELNNVMKIIQKAYENMVKAYSITDNTQYSTQIFGGDFPSTTVKYYIYKKPNRLYINSEFVYEYTNNMRNLGNSILEYNDRISSTGVSREILRIENFLDDYGYVRRSVRECISKSETLANAIDRCIDLYIQADKSCRTVDGSLKFIANLSSYKNALEAGYDDINIEYLSNSTYSGNLKISTLTGLFDTISSALGGYLSKVSGGKDLFEKIVDKLGKQKSEKYADLFKGVKNLNDYKTILSFVTGNTDAVAKLIDGKDFSISDLMSLVKTDTAFGKLAATLESGKYEKLYEKILNTPQTSADARKLFDNMNKYGELADILGLLGQGAGFISTVYNLAIGKEGTEGIDIYKSLLGLGKSGISISAYEKLGKTGAKEYMKKASLWFTFAEMVGSVAWQGSKSYSKYNEDGTITFEDGTKIAMESSLSGLSSLVESASFGLIQIDTDSASEGLYKWADDVSQTAADIWVQKGSILEKIKRLKNMVNDSAGAVARDKLYDINAFNNSAYYAYLSQVISNARNPVDVSSMTYEEALAALSVNIN